MKHARGIDLRAPFSPSEFGEHDGKQYQTLRGLREWEVLGARCGKCGRVALLDKTAVLRQCGDRYLRNLRGMLKCQCGNREGNRVLVGTLPR
ncbi:hypothetical protein [Pararhizobium sp.]|uniref:hypothetical protein n=1 Tax=Pararhizobium sp. TaxID=1977563 RepID=UPI003D0FB187